MSGQFSAKTRVLITGSLHGQACELLKKTSEFSGFPLNFSGAESLEESDFIVFTESTAASPNIILLAEKSSEPQSVQKLISEISDGGIFIFDAENHTAATALEQPDKFFRKITYSATNITSTNGEVYFKTPFGALPLPIGLKENPELADAVRELCQHISISEENFYESLLS